MKNNKKISFEAYQKMASYYFNEVDEKPFNAYYERPAILSMLPDVENKKVLDAGCAAGWYSRWLLDRNADVTAIDFSPKMVEMTKKRLQGRGRVLKADLNNPLDFLKNNSFDLILSSLTLHYIENLYPVLKEFNKKLKSGGVLVFSVHHPFMTFSYFKRENYFEVELLEDEWKTTKGKVKVSFYRRPLKEIINPVVEGGFTIEKIDEPMPTQKFREKSPKMYKRLTEKPQFLFVKAVKTEKIEK